MKTQLGDSAFRAHNMHRIAVREVIAFVASVIRHEILRKCRNAKPSIDTNTAIKELNLINMNLIPASYLGPLCGGGDYMRTFLFIIGFAVCGAILTLTIRDPRKKTG